MELAGNWPLDLSPRGLGTGARPDAHGVRRRINRIELADGHRVSDTSDATAERRDASAEPDLRTSHRRRIPGRLSDQRRAYDEMRARGPVAHSDFLGWSLFAHRDVVEAVRDTVAFSRPSPGVSRELVGAHDPHVRRGLRQLGVDGCPDSRHGL